MRQGRFTNLKRVFDISERGGNRVIKVFLGDPRERLETSPREPFRDIFDCGSEFREIFCKELF